jgi:DNA-binding GntR family transcriptional regulator
LPTKKPSKSSSVVSTPDRAVEAISRAIQVGKFVPGQRLVEADLMRELGISRNPLREALKRLSADGLVSLTPFQGASVRMVSRIEAIELTQVLQVTTGLAARLAAEKINARGNKTKLKSAAKGLLSFRNGVNSIDFVKEREKFYETLLEIAGSNELRKIVQGLRAHLLRVQMMNYLSADALKRQFDMYQKVIDHISSGNGSKAEAAMHKRAQIIIREMEKIQDEDFSDHKLRL